VYRWAIDQQKISHYSTKLVGNFESVIKYKVSNSSGVFLTGEAIYVTVGVHTSQ